MPRVLSAAHPLVYHVSWIITCLIVVGDCCLHHKWRRRSHVFMEIVHHKRSSSVNMAAAIVGDMETFDPDSELIVVYLEWMQLYFEANRKKAE